MSNSKGKQLWDACASGHLDLVKSLASDSGVNVNWIGPDRGDAPLHRASRFGHFEVVKFLLKHPKVDVNGENAGDGTPFSLACQEGHLNIVSLLMADTRVDVNKPMNEGATPFYIACQENHKEVVSLLLADRRVDVNTRDIDGVTPFLITCQNGHHEVVSLLLADPRINISIHRNDGISPLWFASQFGHLLVVQLILASGRDVDTKIKPVGETYSWQNKTAAEIARYQGIRGKYNEESEEEYARSKQNGPLIAILLDSFDLDRVFTRQRLRELPELRDSFISDLFALVVFHCDGLLTVTARSSSSTSSTSPTSKKAARFFQLAQCLPIELQMMLCNCVLGTGKSIVLTKHSEPAFKKLGKLLAWS